jgi:Protein of unknown function (DUF3800)
MYELPSPVGHTTLMANFYIYGDESGKMVSGSDVTSFCGFVGSASEFSRVMEEWDNCRLGWGAPPLHMRFITHPERDPAWSALKQQWEPLWDKKCESMLIDFSSIIVRSHIACVGCAVDSAYFRAMPDCEWKRNMQDPVYLGLYTLIMESLDKIDKVNKALPVSLVVDGGDEKYVTRSFQLLEALKIQLPRVRDRIVAITFADDTKYPALQMADMIAFEARALMVKRLSDPKAPHSELYANLTKRGVHQPAYWDKEHLDKASL